MSQPKQEASEVRTAPTVLLTGASGYIGNRLISLLEKQPVTLRCLARNPGADSDFCDGAHANRPG